MTGRAPSTVLVLLRPLLSRYVERADGLEAPDTGADALLGIPTRAGEFAPCVLDDIVVVDAKRRIWLPRCWPGGPASVTAGPGRTLLVTPSAATEEPVEGRCRTVLPAGLMAGVGIAVGDRVAVAHEEGRRSLIVARAVDLAVRLAA